MLLRRTHNSVVNHQVFFGIWSTIFLSNQNRWSILMKLAKLIYGLACLPAMLCTGANALPAASLETSDCNELIASESPAVRQAYQKAEERGVITSGHQCLLQTADQVDDIGTLLESIPENTVLFVVHKAVKDGSYSFTHPIHLMDTPDLPPDSRLIPPNSRYSLGHRHSLSFSAPRHSTSEQKAKRGLSALPYIQLSLLPEETRCIPSKTAAHIKKGTVLLGVNEHNVEGSVPVCEAENPERIWLMFEVGANDQFEDIGKLYISGFNFYPLLDNNPNPVDSVWRIRCYTGSIYFEDNYFRLDTRASVYLQCTHNTRENVYFSFRGNTVVGMGEAISQEGLLVDLRHLENQQTVADISDNWLAGNIKSAIEVRLDNGSKVNIENNHIRPALSEFRQVLNGLELHGPDSSGHVEKNTPEITVRNNYLQSQDTSLVFYGALNVSVAGNKMTAAELLTTPAVTDQGYSIVPAVTLSSPAINRWFSDSGQCPPIQDRSSLKGNLNFVVKPGGRRCYMTF